MIIFRAHGVRRGLFFVYASRCNLSMGEFMIPSFQSWASSPKIHLQCPYAERVQIYYGREWRPLMWNLPQHTAQLWNPFIPKTEVRKSIVWLQVIW
jgi:hypothetical protein